MTTASLPWMTGTSVNPLLRAAYLEFSRQGEVCGQRCSSLGHPVRSEAGAPERDVFETPEEQKAYIRSWSS